METSLFLAKLIGLYGLVVCVLWLVRGKEFNRQIEESVGQPTFLILSGFLALIAGLAIVIGHNVWEANWRVAITIVGYLSLSKGIVMLGFPGHMTRVSRFFLEKKSSIVYGCVMIPLAAWLAWIGFTGG